MHKFGCAVYLVNEQLKCRGASRSIVDSGGIVMERDVVCGMQVDPAKAAGSSQCNGKTYYFCSKVCKAKFDANPAQYAK